METLRPLTGNSASPIRLPGRLGEIVRSSLLAKVSLLICSGGLMLAVVFVLLGAPFIYDYEEKRNLAHIDDLLATVETTARIACFTQDQQLAKDVAAGLMTHPSIAGVRVSSDERILIESGSIPSSLGLATRVERDVMSPFSNDHRVGHITVIADGEAIRTRARDYSVFFTGLLVLIVVIGTLMMAYLILRIVVRPITRFAEQLHGRDGDGPALLRPPRHNEHDELGMLAASFNKMMQRMNGLLYRANVMYEKAERQEQQFRTLAENSPDIIARYDDEGRLVFANPAFARQTGIPLDEAVGHALPPHGTWRPQLSADLYLRRVRQVIHSGESDRVYWEWAEADGRQTCHEIYIVAEYDHGGSIVGALAIGRDISERRQFEQQLLFQANHDTLTGLPNRTLLKERLQHAIHQSSRDHAKLAVIFIDLDNFKQVNDSLGHDAGDDLLQQMASRMCGALRVCDTVARLGGDEFVVLLEDISSCEDIDTVLIKLTEAVTLPCNLAGNRIFPAASFGVAVYPEDGEDADLLMSNADTAMYVAKGAGTNQYRYFSAGMNEALQQWMNLSNRLHAAVENNALSLNFQPKASLDSGEPAGVEALLRWHDPELGWVSPAQFIPVAEKNGLIDRIGQWVLNEACRQMRAWLDAGIDAGRVAINLSASQRLGETLTSQIEEALAIHHLSGDRLEIEITESIVMADAEESIRAFWSLRDLGVAIAVDDFGTGYSSLSYLKRLPVDKLKIDKAFIDDIERDPNDMEIVRAIIAMAHSLGLTVVAEGVECAAQVATLHRAGCDQIQGYHFSRPQPPAALAEWLQSQPRLALPPESKA